MNNLARVEREIEREEFAFLRISCQNQAIENNEKIYCINIYIHII